jgi:uncharacterized protein
MTRRTISGRGVICAIILVLCFAAPVAAGLFEDGVDADERGDYATAMRLWRPLADQGDANAQNRLGIMYEAGLGVMQDFAAAVRWFRKAADQGLADAQLELGWMYEHGQGEPQDYTAALRWYRRAAAQGDADAQSELGNMYESGRGVKQNHVRAHLWFNLSAAGGNEEAAKNRDIVAAKMTPAQIAEAQKLAREWKPPTASR